jgi:hypothetical protein
MSDDTQTEPFRWETAADANREIYWPAGTIAGCRSRFEPDVSAEDRTRDGHDYGWPVSTHTVVRTEAWAAFMDDENRARVAAILAALPGAFEHGEVDGVLYGRRPYAWVLRRQGKGSYCSHTQERWSKARR